MLLCLLLSICSATAAAVTSSLKWLPFRARQKKFYEDLWIADLLCAHYYVLCVLIRAFAGMYIWYSRLNAQFFGGAVAS